MSNSRALVLLALFSFLAISFTGCDRCSSDDAEAAEQSVSELAATVPATADLAIVVPQLNQFPDTVAYTIERIGHFHPDAQAYEQYFSRQWGVDLTDIESWEEAGFDTDGSAVLSLVAGRPVLSAHIDDEDAFEDNIIEHFRRQLGTEGAVEEETIAGRSFRISGDDASDDMAWFFDNSRVIWVMPPEDLFAIYESGSAASVANKLGGLDEEASLAHSEAFSEFQKGLGHDYPISLYIDVRRHLEAEDLHNDALGMTGFNSLIEGMAEWSQSNAAGAGIGLRAGDQRIEVRNFIGGDDEIIAEAKKAYATEADVDWSGMLTERTVLGTRTGFDLQKTIDTYLESLPDDHRRMIRREMQRASDDLGIDVEEDILAAFSGHTSLAFQGITGDIATVPTQVMSGDIDRALQTLSSNMELLISFHFADIDKMSQLAEMAEEQGQGLVERDALTYRGEKTDDVEILAPADVDTIPLRLAIKDDVVTFATAGVSEDALYEYLTATHDDTPLADSEDFPLGAQFAEADAPNGLYLNFANLRRNMRNIPLIAGSAGTIEVLHELLMSAGVDEYGFHVDTVLQFTDPLDD